MGKFYIAFLIALASCTRPVESEMVLAGILRHGEPTDSLQLLAFAQTGNAGDDLNGATAVILDGAGNEFNFAYSAGYLRNVGAALLPQAGMTYHLTVNGSFGILKTSASVPTEIDTTFLDHDTYTIDPGNPAEAAFLINWNDVAGYSFILQLENLETNPQPLPFAETGLFNSYYDLPIIESYAILPANFFSHFGEHRLTVYCIDRQYEDFYFYSPADAHNLLHEATSNISGGKGYFTGVTSFSIHLFVSQ